MNSGDKTGFEARPKNQSSAATGAFSHDETTPLWSTKSGPADNNSSEIDVTESTGLDGTQTCGEFFLMPSTSPEGAKLGCITCSSTHVAIDMSLENNNGSLPLGNQRKLPAEITSRCKQCEEIFTISIGEQWLFAQKAMSTPAWCARCRRLNRSKALSKAGGDIPEGCSESTY